MARNKPDHRARATLAYPIIRAVAHRGERITYGDLCAQLGLHHRSAAWFLGVMQERFKRDGLPPLQVIVVNKKQLRPGAGYTATPRHGEPYSRARKSVYSYEWPEQMRF